MLKTQDVYRANREWCHKEKFRKTMWDDGMVVTEQTCTSPWKVANERW